VRIHIACSSYSRQLDDYVARSLRRVAANFRAHGHDCPDWEPDGALYVDRWRNMAAERALELHADALFFHDADQCVYVDESTDLAELLDIDHVVGAAYVSRQSPPGYVLRVMTPGGVIHQPDAAEMCGRTKPFPAYWIGTGAMWVRTPVFRKVPFPWFVSGYRADGHYVGEDVFFCEAARAAGFVPICQPAIVTGHMVTGMLMHRPGVVGGAPPGSCADQQEQFRTVVGDVVTAFFQEERLARLGDDNVEGHQRRD
jgi:hypothetical protein